MIAIIFKILYNKTERMTLQKARRFFNGRFGEKFMNMPLIYSVEDDESIRELLECTMDASGFRIVTFPDAESMLDRLEQKKCDLILMDIMLPHMDGIEALKHVKAKYSDLPVILLSAKGTELNKVKGLEAGADDYIAKPFGILELIARIKARLRGTQKKNLEYENIRMDDGAHTVKVAEEEILLTIKEYELLKYLLLNTGSVVKRDDLLSDIWGIDFDGETRTLDMHIMSLRSKLKSAGDVISTVRGVGYSIGKK